MIRITFGRFFATALILTGSFGGAHFALARCCKCTTPDAPTAISCITSQVTDCTSLPSSSKNEAIKKITCTGELSDSQCKKVSDGKSGLCQNGPVDEASFTAKGTQAEAEKKKLEIVTPDISTSIPGLTFSQNITAKDGFATLPFIGQYIAAVYRYLIGISVVAAAVMVVYGGFLYIVGASGAKVQSGKEIITDALIGLAVLLSATVILRMVNPDTAALDSIRMRMLSPEIWKAEEEGTIPQSQQGQTASLPALPGSDGSSAATSIIPKSVCSGTACASLCNGGAPKDDLKAPEGMATKEQLVPIPAAAGLEPNGQLVRKEAADALVKAAAAAQAWAGGPYVISVVSGMRPFSSQVALACQKIQEGNASKIGDTIASPGGSIHGTGLAVDIRLKKEGKTLVNCCSARTQTIDTKESDAALLQQIMSSIGWVRYCKEVWHFEWLNANLAMRSQNCKWPPM